MRVFFGIVLCMPLVILLTWRIVCSYGFSIECSGYLKRAADANTVELARLQLDIAIKYIEENNLTNGYCSIFLKQPKNDIRFWYNNLKASAEELASISQTASQLEKTNVLMKLRETLLDHGESTTITMPDGISIYPNNKMFFWLCITFLVIAGVGVFLILSYFDGF
jgi:hypothetical protein